MKTRTMLSVFIFMVLLIPAIDAKPVIIGFNGTIDQNIIKHHGITNYTQYNIINAISADIPDSVSEKLKKDPKIKYVEDDALVQIAIKPTQPQPPQPPQQVTWGVARVKAPEAWNSG